MSAGQPISKPVLAFVIGGLALAAAIVWFGLLHHGSHPAGAPAPGTTDDATESQPSPVLPASPAPALVSNESRAVIPISLTRLLDSAENGVLQNDPQMQSLPHGTQFFGGIEFWLQGMIHLQGLTTRDDYKNTFRTRVVVPLDETNLVDGQMTVRQNGKDIACIYLVGATRFNTPQTVEKFAEVIWHYADGSEQRSGLEYNVQLRDWWRAPYEQPAQLPNALTKVAWHGPHPTRKDWTLRLYRIALINPQPQKLIRSIEFASAMTQPSLLVMALTLDPLMPGARPDNLTSAEMTDPELTGQLQLLVQDTEGHPLADSQVTASSRNAAGLISPKFTTDNNGLALVRYSGSGLETLDVSASHDDYGSRKMVWNLKAGDTVPATYTLKLTAGVNIGGSVMDESKAPIAGAAIALNRFWTGGDEMNQKGEQADFPTQNTSTDAQGNWQAKGLPVGLLDHIFLDVKHPDFIGTNITVGANGTMEGQLRAGTLKIVLQRGIDVHGLVTDENYNPLAGATVWAGIKFYRDRQETKTDPQGRFSFRNISAGSVLFSVAAKGRRPDSKAFSVKAGMPEIVFRLPPGHVIRGIVQDEVGSAVSGVRVVLEGNNDAGNSYEFSTTTGDDGRFTWDGAPDGPQQFYMGKEGFADLRNKVLLPDTDNVVVLHHPRQLQGLVLDADTGQPVTKFSVRTGHRDGENSENLYGVINNQTFGTPDGRFTMSLGEEEDNAIQVSSDDYALQTQSLPDAQNSTVQVTLRLKPSPALRGIVVSPDGTPLPGVSVGITGGGPGNGVSVQGSHLRSWGSSQKIASTDSQGQFAVGPAPETGGMVIAIGDLGFTSASVDQVRANPTLILQPYGRIEGTLKIGGQPGTGKELYFNMDNLGVNMDFNGYKATTDDQGKFSFEKVPPGEGAIVRLVKTSPNSWTHSDRTTVTVQPGQTAQVTLGDAGAILKGTVRLPTPPADGEAPNIQGMLSSQTPAAPAFNSSAEAQAFFSSPEWKELSKQRKNYAIAVNADGSFMVDDVVPGTYSMNISARKASSQPWTQQPFAQIQTSISVPDSANPLSPIDLGEIVLPPVPQAPAR